MKNIFAALAGAILLLAGCDKAFEVTTPLSVTQRDIQLSKDAGSTHVLVYSSGHWTAKFTENVDWASLSKTEGDGGEEGIKDFVFSYSANYGVTRQVKIALESGEARDTITMTQAGYITDPSYAPTYQNITAAKQSATINTPATTNVIYGTDAIVASVSYADTTTTVQWLTDVAVTRSKLSFKLAENTTGEPRIATIKLTIPDLENEGKYLLTTYVNVTQVAESAALELSEYEGDLDGAALTHVIAATENTIWAYNDQIEYTIEGISDDDKWISGVQLTPDGLQFKLSVNKSGAVRQGKITLKYIASDGTTIEKTYSITQEMYPEEITFSDVRNMTEGELTSINYIEGYIVSDPTSKNICQNRQTAQFMFDFTDNDKTAYIESKDGQYGFCIKFSDAADAAKAARFSKVQLQVKGLTLVKESDPECYYLKNATAANLLEIKAGSAIDIPEKIKTIDQITDADIFTYVTVKDLEILSKDGCYTNCTDGYSYKCAANPYSGSSTAPRWDVAPLMMTDAAGNTINMLTNGSATWRRSLTKSGYDLNWGALLPQGTITFNGVVVAETLARYNMESVGRLQLRAMTKDDIVSTGSKFSTTLVEWNWNNRVADIVPEIGTGTIVGAGTIAAASDFNNLYAGASGDGGNGGSTSNQKGLATNSAIKFSNSWWDFTNDIGKCIDIHVSTAGVSGSNLVFGIVWGHGAMGNTTLDSPAHWNLLYSTDGGSTFKKVEGDMIKNRSIVWWTTTSQDSTPGFQEYLRKLPNECFGCSDLVIRLQVADKVTDSKPGTAASTWQTNLGIEKATLTNKATELRIGTITLRYN